MTLGERCDEIVRLIDETLEDYATSRLHPAEPADRPLVAAVRTLTRTDLAKLGRTA